MASLNKFQGIGNLGRDPETRYLSNGDAVTNISIGITEKWTGKDGERNENTEWVRVTFFRKLAEIAAQYLKKGSLVYVEGKLQTRKYTDKDGVERYSTEIVADQMQMLGGRQGDDQDEPREQRNAPGGSRPRNQVPMSKRPTPMSDMDDDIPFANPYRGKIGLSI